MPRTKIDANLAEEIGTRISALASDHLRVSITDLANRLGYSTDMTLRQAIRGQTNIGTDRLHALGAIENQAGQAVNLNWVLGGRGYPLWDGQALASGAADFAQRFARLPPDAQVSLIHLLTLLERQR